jgi:hypothetical protein
MCGNSINLLYLAATFIVLLLMLIQMIFAAIRTLSRVKRKAPVKGWVIYWLMIAFNLLCILSGVFATEDSFVLLLITVSFPAIWFFFAGKVSDRQRNQQVLTN